MFSVKLQASSSNLGEGILMLNVGGRDLNAVCLDDTTENKTLMETMQGVCGKLGFGCEIR